MSSTAPDSESSARRPFGWVILGAVIGAWIAVSCAESLPVDAAERLTRRALRVAIAERKFPFAVAGVIAGGILGLWAEESLSQKISLNRAIAYLLLLWIIGGNAVQIALTLWRVAFDA